MIDEQIRVSPDDDSGAGLWIAQESQTGQGSRDFVVIAHRFGYGLEHGFDALMDTEVVAHLCDNPLCQEPRH